MRKQKPELRGEDLDYSEILRDALRSRTCAWCAVELDYRETPRSGFCSRRHYDAFRYDRRKVEDPAARRGAPEHIHCTECGDELTGRQRVICGKASCRDRRFKRLHPEAYAERERQKVERRRDRRRADRAEAL